MRARKEQKKSQKGDKATRQEENRPIERKSRQQEKRSLPESQNDKRKKVSGLVRKHLPEIEKRLVEGDTRDIILDWIRAETGMDIPKTTFIKALYRARQWAKTARPIEAYYPPLPPTPTVQPTTLTTPKKEPKKHVEHVEEVPDGRRENSLPENPTGQDRLRAALNTPTPTLDFGGSRRRGR